MKKRVAIVGTVGIPAKYGGFETLTHQLVKSLRDSFDITVCCSSKAYRDRSKEIDGARLKYIPFKANGVQSVIYDIISIISVIRKTDVLLILGVSGTLILPVIRFFTRKKIIVHIDGLEWRREKWNKWAKKFLKWSEKIGVKYGDIVIADNQAIREYVFKEYSKESVLIEYGADHIYSLCGSSTDQGDYAFSVCRIEPENNIHIILEAFSKIPDFKLKFVGNWQVNEYGKTLKKKYSCFPHLELIDPIYEQKKLDNLRSKCKVYIHGHSAGGTNPSLVEAMYLGLPIVAFDVSYNRYSTENLALYFRSVDDLVNKINNVTQMQLNNVAKSMFEIAKKRYTWEIVADKYKTLFLDERFRISNLKKNTA